MSEELYPFNVSPPNASVLGAATVSEPPVQAADLNVAIAAP